MQGTPEYLDAVTDDSDEESEGFDLWEQENSSDDLYDRAVAIVARDRKASTSYIQRKLQIGYNRAARLMERMEEEGVVTQANHAGKREIMVGDRSA
jgi:S-DNA-T family DNA segregation ATPase FtsK/SpoIIIE